MVDDATSRPSLWRYISSDGVEDLYNKPPTSISTIVDILSKLILWKSKSCKQGLEQAGFDKGQDAVGLSDWHATLEVKSFTNC